MLIPRQPFKDAGFSVPQPSLKTVSVKGLSKMTGDIGFRSNRLSVGSWDGGKFCYGEPTRDDHSDTVCRQLRVFVPASWTTLRHSGPNCSTECQSTGFLKTKNHILASQSAVASRTLGKKVVWQKQR